ncbi:MAG TPA: hypothetical protein VGK53_14675, partial [Propionicimonas sp.]
MRIAVVLAGAMLLSGCAMAHVRLEPLDAETAAPVMTSGPHLSVHVGPVVVPGVTAVAGRASSNADCASVVQRLTVPTGEYTAAALKPGCPATTDTP